MADIDAMQAQIKALEAQLAAAKEQEDPDGEYILEEYEEEEEYGEGEEDVYVIEEYIDDGQEFDDEMIEIVEEYEDDEYEEVIEEEEYDEGLPPIDPVVDTEPCQKSFSDGNNKSVTFAGADLAELQAHSAPAAKPAAPAAKPAAPAPPAPKPTAPSPRPLRPTPAPRASGGGSGGAVDFSKISLKKTGIKLDEAPAQSPYTFTAPPKAHPPKAVGPPPKAVPARDSPEDVPQAQSFLAGVQQTDERKAAAEEKALKAVSDEPGAEAQPRKKWIPMKERQPEKFPKNSLELREMPKSTKTKLAPLPFKQRNYPTLPASPSGQENAAEKILGSYLYKNVKMERVNVTAAMQDQEILLLYFGASWRAGCKAFHQQLIDFYKLTSKDCNLECVYVSADRTLFEFKDIYQKFPFLAMPTGTVDYKNQMTQDFKIADMPALVVLNAQTCQLITLEGVEDLSSMATTRDRELAQKIVAKWKSQKPRAAPAKKKPAANAAAETTPAEPAAAGGKPISGGSKPLGRKERKGLFSWKKR